MTMTDTPPDTDTKAAAVEWVRSETAAGREPSNAAVMERYGVSERTARNYRNAAKDADADRPDAPVVPIRGNATGNGDTPPAVAAPEPNPAPATPSPVAAANNRNAPAVAAAAGNGNGRQPATATRPAAPATTARPAPRAAATRRPSPTPARGKAHGTPTGASDAVVRATTVAVLGVAIVAAVVSYEHMRLLAEDAGESWWRAALLPLSVDGLVVVASAVMLTRRRQGRPGGVLAGCALTLGILASLAANVVSSDPTLAPEYVVRWAVAGWSPLSLAVSFELLLQLRAERAHGPIAPGDGGGAVTRTNRWEDAPNAGGTASGRSQEGGRG